MICSLFLDLNLLRRGPRPLGVGRSDPRWSPLREHVVLVEADPLYSFVLLHHVPHNPLSCLPVNLDRVGPLLLLGVGGLRDLGYVLLDAFL